MRRVAESFYRRLIAYLERHEDHIEDALIWGQDGSYHLRANKFWKHPKANKLIIKFETGGSGYGGAMGTSQGWDVMVLPALLGQWNPKHLATRIDRTAVIHELIHYLTPEAPGGSGTARMAEKGETSRYYNSPAEWQAFWQEGAAQLERTLRWPSINHPNVREQFVGDGSINAILARAKIYWNKDFLFYMDAKTKRKFDKRLAQLWAKMKQKGLL